jgi:GT2 family glycosyltransferase
MATITSPSRLRCLLRFSGGCERVSHTIERQLQQLNRSSTRATQRAAPICGNSTAVTAVLPSPGAISVVVITRDRPRDLERCLNAVLASSYRDFELVVVDQSAGSTSQTIVEGLAMHDARVRLVRDSGKGAARARNAGTAATMGNIVVFTDDDCEPRPDWLGLMVEALEGDATVGIAFGSVIPAPHDSRDGFIVGFSPSRAARLTGRLSKLHDAGISASVALRRSALDATGGFDEVLGPGSYFPCAEDYDLTYRVLSRGYALLHVPQARVIHHGLRDWESGGGLIHRTYVAIGAAYMKHVRLHDTVGAMLLFQEIWRAVANICVNVARRRGPFGFGRLQGLLLGAVRSFELRVERDRAIYVMPN